MRKHGLSHTLTDINQSVTLPSIASAASCMSSAKPHNIATHQTNFISLLRPVCCPPGPAPTTVRSVGAPYPHGLRRGGVVDGLAQPAVALLPGHRRQLEMRQTSRSDVDGRDGGYCHRHRSLLMKWTSERRRIAYLSGTSGQSGVSQMRA